MQNKYKLKMFTLDTAKKMNSFIKEHIDELNLKTISEKRNFLVELLKSSNINFVLENINRVQSTLLCELKASYVQQSQRYVRVNNISNSYHFEDLINLSPRHKFKADELIEEAFNLYKKMSEIKEESKNKSRTTKEDYKYGIPIEDARYILPLVINTNISIAMNGSKLIDFIDKTYENSNNMIYLKPILDDLLYELPSSLRKLIDSYMSDAYKYNRCSKHDESLIEKFYNKTFSGEKVKVSNLIDKELKDPLIKTAIGAATSTSKATPSEKLKEWEEDSDVVHPNMVAQHLVSNVLGYGHDSISEQARNSLVYNMSLVTYHQFIRHRLADNKRQSLKDIFDNEGSKYYIPDSIKNSDFIYDYKRITEKFNDFRKELSKYSYPDPSALFLLNNSMINVHSSINYRIEKDVLNERLCMNSQTEIREISKKKLKVLNEKEPTIMRSARPDCMLEHGCQEGKLSCGKTSQVKKEIESIIK